MAELETWLACGRAFLIVGLVAVGGCSGVEVAPAVAPQTLRSVMQGDVVGFVAENGAYVWRGLPYAASTAGPNRWRAPVPAPAWRGKREALLPGVRCAQLTSEFDADEGLEPGLVVGSEDCLTLDIYAPAANSNSAHPVMVWIHGGGNVSGRSSIYDGSRLAENERIVVVAVQYRLGPLGYFAHPLLRAGAETLEDAAANFAILDLIAALEWVRDNIAVFGGDPGNVTISGVSAGGHNVAALLASPMASGLFHRAIIQSGSFDSISIAEAEGRRGNRANTTLAIATNLGVDTADTLRRVPLETLLAAYERSTGFLDVPRMIEDGVVLPKRPLREVFQSNSDFNAVPIITGTTRDEMKLFYAADTRLTKKVLWLFPVARDQDTYDAVTGYITRLWRLRAVDEPAFLMNTGGHGNVYAYRFDWDDGGDFLWIDFRQLFGAAHGFDTPFVFNRFEHLGDADAILFSTETEADRQELSRIVGRYWATFARDGIPTHPNQAAWPAFEELGGTFIQFDAASDGGIRTRSGRDSLDTIISDLKADRRLNEAWRCFVVEELRTWLFTAELHPQFQAATGCLDSNPNVDEAP